MQQKNKIYKTGFYIIVLLSCLQVYGQSKLPTTNLDITKLPKEIKFTGKIKTAVSWKDKLGNNIVITTKTGTTTSKNAKSEDYKSAALYTYHYITNKDSTYLTWKIYDFIKECPFDIEVSFIKNTFQITDLNHDGIAEIWLMYKTGCRSDVSPYDMKIIMYEGQQKYCLRGQNKVQVSKKEFYGGDYKIDNKFKNGPKEFLNFAKKLWNKNIIGF